MMNALSAGEMMHSQDYFGVMDLVSYTYNLSNT